MTTVKRKEYDAEGSLSVLSLPAKQVTEEFDGSVTMYDTEADKAAGNPSFHHPDVFDVNEISFQGDNDSSGMMKLCAKVAAVRLQPRLIPHAFSAPKVNGLVCTKNATLQDGVWLDCGTTLTSATPQTVSALNASDDAVKALMQEVSQVLGIPCASLWQIGDTSGVVSFADSGYTDGEALMDGRSTMAGYPVSGATEMVWTALGSAQLMALNASSTQKNGKSLLCRLLTMLGMPETMAQQEQAALSGSDGILDLTGKVSADGLIELKNDDDTNPLIVGTEAKSRLLYKNGTSNAPWISVNADGGSTLLWPDNKGDVFALLAGMAKKAMDGICGIGLVGVGVNGGVPQWMMSAVSAYGIPLGNLVKAYAEWSNVKKTFEEGQNPTLIATGSQSVNLGKYNITDNTDFDIIFKQDATNGTYPCLLLGSYPYASSKCIWLGNNSYKIGWQFGGTERLDRYDIGNTSYHRIHCEKNKFYVDETLVDTNTDKTFTNTSPTTNMQLFAKVNARYVKGRIKIALIKEGDVYVFVLVPFVRNNINGLLNLKTNIFYPSETSTPFGDVVLE